MNMDRSKKKGTYIIARIQVDFSKQCGKVKPMHATNKGSVYKFASDQRITNIDAFREAGIPYARNHDASFYATYGGEHTVDVHAIFPRFEADPYDPASYDFPVTDEYIKVFEFAGVRTFYRLGSKIEHGVKKYGMLPLPIFINGRSFASMSFAVTPRAGQTASTIILSIGRSGTSRISIPTILRTSVAGAARN